MRTERGIAVAGTLGGAAALLSAAACCVLPLALAAVGLGVGGLAGLVPYHWPLTVGAASPVAVGWGLYVRRRRACARGADCRPPSRAAPAMLAAATMFILLSALWPIILERPLMQLLTGA